MTNIISEDPKQLAELKLQGKLLTKAERKLVPKFDKQIYLIIGSTGTLEEGVYRTWVVRAFRLHERALEYATACEQAAQKWEDRRSSFMQSPPFGWSQLDPSMCMYHTGTFYTVVTTSIEMREEDFAHPEDTCTICGAQVEAGYCERGHEVLR